MGARPEVASTSSSEWWGTDVNYSQYKKFFGEHRFHVDFNPLWEVGGPYPWLRSDHLHQYLIGIARTLGSRIFVELFLSVCNEDFDALVTRIKHRISNLRPGVNRVWAVQSFEAYAQDWWDRNKKSGNRKTGKPLRWPFTGHEAYDFFVQDFALVIQDVNAGLRPSHNSRFDEEFRQANSIPLGATKEFIEILMLANDYCHLTTAPYYTSDDLLHLHALALLLMRYLWICFAVCTPKWWMLLSIAQERRMYGSNANNCTSVFEAAHKDVKKCKTNQQTGVSDKQRLGHQLRVDKATSVASSLRELEGHSKRILEVWVDQEGNEVQEMARTSAREQRVADILDASSSRRSIKHYPFPDYAGIVLHVLCVKFMAPLPLRRRGYRSKICLSVRDLIQIQHPNRTANRVSLIESCLPIRQLPACLCLHLANLDSSNVLAAKRMANIDRNAIPTPIQWVEFLAKLLHHHIAPYTSRGILHEYHFELFGSMRIGQQPTDRFEQRFTVSEAIIRAVPFQSVGYGAKRDIVSSDVAYYEQGPQRFQEQHGYLGTEDTYPRTLSDLDPSLPHHWDLVRFGTILCLFQTPIRNTSLACQNQPANTLKSFAFMRLYHRFCPPRDVATAASYQQLVRPRSDCESSFKVVPIECILGLVPVVSHPSFSTIPHSVPGRDLSLPDHQLRFNPPATLCHRGPIVAVSDSQVDVHDGWDLRVVHHAQWRNCRSHLRGFSHVEPLPFPTPFPADVAAIVKVSPHVPS